MESPEIRTCFAHISGKSCVAFDLQVVVLKWIQMKGAENQRKWQTQLKKFYDPQLSPLELIDLSAR